MLNGLEINSAKHTQMWITTQKWSNPSSSSSLAALSWSLSLLLSELSLEGGWLLAKNWRSRSVIGKPFGAEGWGCSSASYNVQAGRQTYQPNTGITAEHMTDTPDNVMTELPTWQEQQCSHTVQSNTLSFMA